MLLTQNNNSLYKRIVDLIKEKQFIGIDEFINICLYDNTDGYYINKSPIGLKQDFTTAPEISQLFGEMIAFWIIHKWQNLKEPNVINLIELGAGNGTLMLDILNIIKKVPKLLHSVNVFVVEINKKLQEIQKKKLDSIITNQNIKITWLSNIEKIKEHSTNKAPSIIVANEFLDVFPIKQFKYVKSNWHEVGVILGNKDSKNNSVFSLALNKTSSKIDSLLPKNFTAKDGMIFEHSSPALKYFNKITNLIKSNNGAALIIDYGYLINPYTNTIQAIHKHKKTSFLNNVGYSDITYLVNFPLLLEELKKNTLIFNLSLQNNFFINLGIMHRMEVLLKIATSEQKRVIISGVNRILDINNMGSLFKVLEIQSK